VEEGNVNDGGSERVRRETRQCMAEIVLNIDTRFVAAVMSLKEPKDVWIKLKEMHKMKCAASQITLRRRIVNLRMEPEQTIRSYVNSICEIENELGMKGLELSDEDKKFALLEGLREEYSILKSILQHQQDLSFEEMVSRLESREDDIERQTEETPTYQKEKSGASFVATDDRKHNNQCRGKGSRHDRKTAQRCSW